MSEDCISNSQNSNEVRKGVKSDKDHDDFSLPRKQRLEYPKNVVLGYLNINSLRNKFVSILELIKKKVDIFLKNETRLDGSFLNNQFTMSGYEFIRMDKNKFGGGIAFYITDQLLIRTIKIENPSDIEILTIEINTQNITFCYRYIQTVIRKLPIK